MIGVTNKYLEAGGYVVCTYWSGDYSDGLSLTSNIPKVNVNFWAVTGFNFRRAYKNESKGKENKCMIMNTGLDFGH